MVSKKPKKKKKNHLTKTPLSAILNSAIHSPQGIKLKLPVLKSLYYVLLQFSLKTMKKWFSFETESSFKQIYRLSDVLFQEFDGRFKQFLSGQSHEPASIEELAVLLRCCLVLLTLLVPDQNLVIQKGRVLLSILSTLISRATQVEYKGVGDGDSFDITLCALLQVFADELLMHKSLREYFVLIDSASSASEMLFMSHFGHGDIGTVLEVVAAHFILSVSSDRAFECFLNRLFWQHGKDLRIPEMSLTASLSLLLNPVMLSAPKMFQAYLILLVSEAVGICMHSEYLNPDLRIMDCYLTAFERSIILYNSHFSSLHMDDLPIGSSRSTVKSCMLGSSQLAFESYLQPATKTKMKHLVTKLNESWDSDINNVSQRTKSDLVDASIAYVKESLNIIDKSHRGKMLSILTSIVHRASSDNMCETVWCMEGRSSQDMYLLASILKLMSSSMLQAIWCLRHSSNSSCLKTLQDVLLQKECDFIMHLVGFFRQFSIHLPIQKFMSDAMKTHSMRHKESKWMLLHFSGLLSLSYIVGLDFLIKDCIFAMMSLLNLFAFEEGDLDALSPLFASGLESISSRPSEKVGEASLEQKSSKRVALKFQKLQTMYLSRRSLKKFHKRNKDNHTETSENASDVNRMESTIHIEEETQEACNGEIFLQYVLEGSQGPSDLHDLADFIECKQGKDYFGWLKNRQRFRNWKCERKAVYRRQKWKKKQKYRNGSRK